MLCANTRDTHAATCPSEDNAAGWTTSTMDSTIGYKVHHKTVGSTLHLKLEAQHVENRWLGFGLAEQNSGHMKGSDMVTVSITAGGKVNCEDRFATFAPSKYTEASGPSFQGLTAQEDSHQDWTIVYGRVDSENGRMVVYITRALDTGDQQDRVVKPGPRRVIWSHGTGSVAYHGPNRGATRIAFIEGGTERTFPTADGSWIRRMSNYSIPAQTTTYACQSFEFPTDVDRHIVAVKPIIDEASKAYPHHAILHVCQNNTYWNQHTSPTLCSGNGGSPLGETTSQCSSLMWSWAVGLGDFIIPEAAGFLVGNGTSKVSHVILEIHYDNPRHLSNIIDSSGFEVFYSNTLRQYNAAGMTLGDPLASFSKMTAMTPYRLGKLSAGTETLHYQATCPSVCTQDLSRNITVFSGFLHMHHFGHKMLTDHYNSTGHFIKTRSRIDYWDNGFQSVRDDDDFVYTIQPGDSLQTHCYYNTLGISNDTIFGTATADEMCMDFIFYYPAQFRGADNDGKPQLFAFCGATVQEINGNESLYTLCGSLSQTTANFLLSGGQLNKGNASFADPLNFGIINKNAGGTSKVADQCTAVGTTTTTSTTTTTQIPTILGSASSAITMFTSSFVNSLLLSSCILHVYFVY